eukprot:jgi/Chrzof1/4551/Cz14g18010.t1
MQTTSNQSTERVHKHTQGQTTARTNNVRDPAEQSSLSARATEFTPSGAATPVDNSAKKRDTAPAGRGVHNSRGRGRGRESNGRHQQHAGGQGDHGGISQALREHGDPHGRSVSPPNEMAAEGPSPQRGAGGSKGFVSANYLLNFQYDSSTVRVRRDALPSRI